MESLRMETPSLDSVKQYKLNVPDESAKITVIAQRIISSGSKTEGVIIYVGTRKSADMLYEALDKAEFDVSLFHGDLTKQEIDETVMLFNTTWTQVVVTTEPLPKDFDLSLVNLVNNYDLPVVDDSSGEKYPDTRVYLQRFCSTGAVFNLLCGDTDKMIMEKIKKHLNHVVTEVPSWECNEDVRMALRKAGPSFLPPP